MSPMRAASVLSVLAVFAGCGGGGGGAPPPPPPPPPPDTTAPTVSAVQAPSGPASRTVTLTATASDNVGVAEVRFFAGSTLLGSDTTAPYSIQWDTGGVADGDHALAAEARDAAGNVARSADVTVTVRNARAFAVALSGAEIVPASDSRAGAQADLAFNLATGSVQGTLTVTGVAASGAELREGYAGTNGALLLTLVQDAGNPSRFTVAAGATLAQAMVDRLLAGRLYLQVRTAAFPEGELRGQLLPQGWVLRFADLRGFEEVPAIDTRARGRAAFTLDTASGALVVQVRVEGLDAANQSHVHEAVGGRNGPVVAALTRDPQDPGRWFVENAQLDAARRAAFAAGRLYVNVHSPAHPGGEIRGQIIPEGLLFAAGRIEGRQQVPQVASTASGSFALTADPATGRATIHVNARGVDDAIAAHLHDGYAGTNGPVVVTLLRDAVEAGHWSAVDAALDAGQLAALAAGRHYVNVHTPAHVDGELRGQVAPPPVEVLFAPLRGEEEVPAIASVASGLAASTVNRVTGSATVHLRAQGANDATAAHLHEGYAGQSGPVRLGLQQDAADAGHWFASGAQLDAGSLAAYLAGRLYVNLHTPAHPPGEIRGQLVPRGIEFVFAPMDGDAVVPPVSIAADGTAAVTARLATRQLIAFVNTTGAADATSAGIRIGAPGENGNELFALAASATVPGQWSGASGRLDAGAFAAYETGQLYALVTTPAWPQGAIRGQVVPPGAPPPANRPPTVTLNSPGATVSGTVTLTADASDDRGVAEVRFRAGAMLIGTDTTAPYSVDWDTRSVANGSINLTAEAVDTDGAATVSAAVAVTVQNAARVTLTQIQNEVFGPQCSACHRGPTSNTLPSGMNLSTAAASHAALVGVASLQVPSRLRVAPGNPDNSYLIQKLDGTAPVGSRMPVGGPFLDGATMARIRQWIADGAQND